MRKPIKAVLIGTAAAALLAPCTINAFAHSGHGGGTGDTRATTLGALGKRSGVRIGTAVDMAALADDAPYRAKAASEFSSVTPGCGPVRPG
ncbi:endo-1,4-beta-xylanase [Streptomyces sp. NBC_00441]|uniref:hypothetical protein n=1 Tax=Streptomyces sp. NBC_00441 TaxID=2975742 RepID=UPI002E2A847C|nr:hypothetical protein [Streptomyces sp. NBC_00441]